LASILPEFTEKPENFSELLDCVSRRLKQARMMDPWAVFEEPIFEVHTASDMNVARAAVIVLASSIVMVFFTRGIPFSCLAGAAVLLLVWTILIFRRNGRAIRKRRLEGIVTTGAVVQANLFLFDPEEEIEAGAVLVYSFDEDLKRDPPRLMEIANRLFEYKAAPLEQAPENMKSLVRTIKDERMRYHRWPVPREICGNDKTFVADLDMERNRMPNRAIDRRIWLCLSHPDLKIHALEILPLELWWREDLDGLTGYQFKVKRENA
jgi:hypothetical protein